MMSFLGMLIVVYGVAGNMVYGNIGILDELESFDIEEGFDIEEDDEVNVFKIPSWTSERGSKVLVNVDSFGAIGDGVSDDTQVSIYNILYSFTFLVICNELHSVKPMFYY